MKKIALTLIAALTMSMAAQAQNEGKKKGEKKFDKTEMAQKRTDRMVEQYGLNDDQAKKLLALNTEYADKMGPRGGHRGGGHGPGPRPQGNGEQKMRPQGDGQQQGARPAPDKAEMEKMKATHDAYNKELKGIMTDAQYAKYTEDMKKMRQHRGEPKGGSQKRSEY